MKLRHYLEYYAMRAAVTGLRLLGWRGGARMGGAIGRLGFHVIRVRRKVSERQIAFAFPAFDALTVRRVAAAAYANLGRTAIEAALLPEWGLDKVRSLVNEVHGWDALEGALSEQRGVILVTGHLGNWELGGSYLAARGVNIAAVARRMNNPLFDSYLGRTRAGLGMKIFHDADTVRLAPRHLRDNGVLALLADQGVLGLSSTYVPFFGRLARTPRGPAVLSIRLRAPVVFGTCIRKDDGHFTLSLRRVYVEQHGERERDVDAMVLAYTEALEAAVRTAPEQYFWMHRRWRRQPPGMPLLEDDEI